jgi:hypothetical protein
MERSQTRRDLERAIRRLAGDAEKAAEGAEGAAKYSGAALGVLAAMLAYLWGRRRSRRSGAIVIVKKH